MNVLYAFLMVGVSISFLAIMAEAVISVSRKPEWAVKSKTMRYETDNVEAILEVVEKVENRNNQLPFVGQDRRQQEVARKRMVG